MGPWREKGVPSSSFCRKSWDWSLNGSQGGTKTQRAVVSGVPQIKKIKKPREGSQASPTPHPFSPPRWGRRLRPDAAAERTSVPMETAAVGEGSWAQLVSLQGDLGRRPRRLISARESLLPPPPHLRACLGGTSSGHRLEAGGVASLLIGHVPPRTRGGAAESQSPLAMWTSQPSLGLQGTH